jgi:hypothetical protein
LALPERLSESGRRYLLEVANRPGEVVLDHGTQSAQTSAAATTATFDHLSAEPGPGTIGIRQQKPDGDE